MKRFIILMVVILISSSIYAQIERTIGRFTLGKTTKQDLISVLRSEGTKYIEDEEETIVVINDVSYFSITWLGDVFTCLYKTSAYCRIPSNSTKSACISESYFELKIIFPDK